MRFISLAVVFSLFVAAAVHADGTDDMRAGLQALTDGDAPGVIKFFDRAFSSNELEPRVRVVLHLRRSQAYTALKQYDSALADIDTAVADDRDFGMRADNSDRKLKVLAYYNRGIVEYARDNFSGAVRAYDQALAIDPDFSWVVSNRGNAYVALGNCEAARVDYDAAMKATPDDTITLANMAWLLATCADPIGRDGTMALTLAFRAASAGQHPSLQNILAAAYAENGRFTEAIEAQELAISLLGTDDPDMVGRFRDQLRLYQQHKPYHGGKAPP